MTGAAMSLRPRLLPPPPLLQLLVLLPLVLVLVLQVRPVSPQSAQWPCPDSCTCREDHVAQVGRAYAVLCSNQRLRHIPDLSPLLSVNVSVMLKLDYCDLGNVTRGDFPQGLRLAILHLNGNAGLRLAADALQNVRDSLVLLDMQAVNLPFNDTLRYLSGCGRLQELSLSFNNKGQGHTPRVTAGLFKGLGLTALAKLKLYNCNIRSLAEDVFEGAEGLRDLHLGSNLIGEVPRALGRLLDLRVLDLSSNAIAHLPNSSFVALARLQELKLHRNDIDIVEEGAFAGLHASLGTLVMDFCSLREVPTEAIRPLANLTSLDLTGNLFTDIGPDAFVGSYCLNELYVSSRTLSFDKLMFTGQRFCIKDLKIRRAELTAIPLAPVKDLVNLQYLFLDKNNITRLRRDELKGITATSISFSDNPIRTIEKGAFNGLRPKLILLLERTEVSDLGFIFDYPEETFRFLSLYESPIPCDCTLKRLLRMRAENFLYGTCSHRGLGVNLRDPKLEGILAQKCRPPPETVMAAVNVTTRTGAGAAGRPYTVEPQVQRREKQVGGGGEAGEGRPQKASRKKNRRKSSGQGKDASGGCSVRLHSWRFLPGVTVTVAVLLLSSGLPVAT